MHATRRAMLAHLDEPDLAPAPSHTRDPANPAAVRNGYIPE
jgi:hypothetical protein